jgi:hypothetical protein
MNQPQLKLFNDLLKTILHIHVLPILNQTLSPIVQIVKFNKMIPDPNLNLDRLSQQPREWRKLRL